MIIPKFIFKEIIKVTRRKWFAIGQKRALDNVLSCLEIKQPLLNANREISIDFIIDYVTKMKNDVASCYLEQEVRRELKDERL